MGMINRHGLYSLHKHLTRKAFGLMQVKNRDYGENSDPFRNFRTHGLYGILVRLHDKLARLQTFCETGTLTLKSEPVYDCVLDLINYAVLFEGYRVDTTASDYRSNQGQGGARPVSKGLGAGAGTAGGGVRRGSPRGGGGHTFAPAQRAAALASAKPARRVGADSSSGKHVGSKHRPGKGAR